VCCFVKKITKRRPSFDLWLSNLGTRICCCINSHMRQSSKTHQSSFGKLLEKRDSLGAIRLMMRAKVFPHPMGVSFIHSFWRLSENAFFAGARTRRIREKRVGGQLNQEQGWVTHTHTHLLVLRARVVHAPRRPDCCISRSLREVNWPRLPPPAPICAKLVADQCYLSAWVTNFFAFFCLVQVWLTPWRLFEQLALFNSVICLVCLLHFDEWYSLLNGLWLTIISFLFASK
jgi:hypothetical protein